MRLLADYDGSHQFHQEAEQKQDGISDARALKGMLLTAMLIAMSVSVTVSIGELMNGVLRTTFLVIRLSVTTSEAENSILPGRMRKSLYVSPP